MAQRPARADVLDDILGGTPAPTRRPSPATHPPQARPAAPQPQEPQKSTQAHKPRDSSRRARMNVEIPETLAAAVRDAVITLSGPPVRLTLARFAEEAFRREIARLQTEHHGGKPFPATDRVVRVGRPLG